MEGSPSPVSTSNQNPGTTPNELSPIDFVKQQLATGPQVKIQDAIPGVVVPPQATPQVATPSNPLPPATPAHATPIEQKIASPEAADAFVSSLLASDVPQNAPQTSAAPTVPADPTEAPVPGEDPKKTPEQSLKDMRKIIRKTSTEKEEIQSQLAQTRGELEKYQKGEAIPDILQEREDRIKQLEHYEKLHGLKLSPEYQQKFVEPFNKAVEEATALAKDYGVDASVIDEALTITNKRDLNSFLRNNFDDVGALEFRNSLDKIRSLQTGAAEAEREPAQTMQQLQQDFRENQKQNEERRVATIHGNAQRGWREALSELEQSGEYPELTLTGDAEQDKVANQIRTAAAKEYGATVTLLGQQGVKDLPLDAAKILAKRYQLSQAAGIMAASRAHHYNRSEQLLETNRRTASMIRPQVGGMVDSPGVAPAPAKPSETLQDRAEGLLNSVLQKRR